VPLLKETKPNQNFISLKKITKQERGVGGGREIGEGGGGG
jgi:hypothetical protein